MNPGQGCCVFTGADHGSPLAHWTQTRSVCLRGSVQACSRPEPPGSGKQLATQVAGRCRQQRAQGGLAGAQLALQPAVT